MGEGDNLSKSFRTGITRGGVFYDRVGWIGLNE